MFNGSPAAAASAAPADNEFAAAKAVNNVIFYGEAVEAVYAAVAADAVVAEY